MAKLYVWAHSKLSSFQKGLQAGHVLGEMTSEYLVQDGAEPDILSELKTWVTVHKTIVVLEGGTCNALRELSDYFDNMPDEDRYPYANFYEDDLEGSLISVGIILDSTWDKEVRGNLTDLNDWEKGLLTKLIYSREAE